LRECSGALRSRELERKERIAATLGHDAIAIGRCGDEGSRFRSCRSR
jgi:hypothetical protein